MFKERLLTGICVLSLTVLFFVLGGLPLAGFLCLVSCIGFVELVRACKPGDVLHTKEAPAWEKSLPDIVGLAYIVVYYALLAWRVRPEVTAESTGFGAADMTGILILFAAFFLTELAIYVVTFPKYSGAKIMSVVFSFFYAPVMLSFASLTRSLPGIGKYLVWLILISSWGCDTCAYCVGVLIGKHKIFPELSPKKSLEGCIGGVLGAALLGGLYGYLYVRSRLGDAAPAHLELLLAAISAFGALMGMVGDLAASAIKRDRDIKDYGHLLPGHGGIMDRFDSVIMTAPGAFLLAYLILVR